MKKNSKIILALIIVSPIFWIFQDLIMFSNSKTTENTESEEYTDIIGLFNREELLNNPHAEWFNQNYSDYNLDQETLSKLKPLFKDIEITVFMGNYLTAVMLISTLTNLGKFATSTVSRAGAVASSK